MDEDKEGALSDILAFIVMTTVLIYIQVRYGGNKLDRFFKLVLYIFPLSYFLLAIGGMCFLVEIDESRQLSKIINSITIPICLVMFSSAEIMIASEMQIMRSKLVCETAENYHKALTKIKIVRNLSFAILLIGNSSQVYINLEIDKYLANHGNVNGSSIDINQLPIQVTYLLWISLFCSIITKIFFYTLIWINLEYFIKMYRESRMNQQQPTMKKTHWIIWYLRIVLCLILLRDVLTILQTLMFLTGNNKSNYYKQLEYIDSSFIIRIVDTLQFFVLCYLYIAQYKLNNQQTIIDPEQVEDKVKKMRVTTWGGEIEDRPTRKDKDVPSSFPKQIILIDLDVEKMQPVRVSYSKNGVIHNDNSMSQQSLSINNESPHVISPKLNNQKYNNLYNLKATNIDSDYSQGDIVAQPMVRRVKKRRLKQQQVSAGVIKEIDETQYNFQYLPTGDFKRQSLNIEGTQHTSYQPEQHNDEDYEEYYVEEEFQEENQETQIRQRESEGDQQRFTSRLSNLFDGHLVQFNKFLEQIAMPPTRKSFLQTSGLNDKLIRKSFS